MSELPRGWASVRVGEAGRVQLGRQRSPEFHTGANMRPYLRVANVFEDELRLDDVMSMHFGEADVARYELHPGDILLNEGQSRELVGRPAMYRGELPGACFTNSLVRFQASRAVEPAFALQLFRLWLKRGDFQSIGQITTNIAHLGAGRFAEMDFPVPPLPEQRRIVAKLDALQARSRRAKEALAAIPPLLERFRQSVLAAAFRGDLTAEWRAKHPDVEPADALLGRIRAERRAKWEEAEGAKRAKNAKGAKGRDEGWKSRYQEPEAVDASGLPELPGGWCWASVGEVAREEIAYGVVQPGPQVDDGVPFIRAMDLEDGVILEQQLGRIAHAIAEEYERTRLCPGDVLLGIIRAAKVVVVPESLAGGNIVRGIARIPPAAALLPGYLAGWLRGPVAQGVIAAKNRGMDMPVINLSDVRKLAVPVAPMAEQRRLVTALARAEATLRATTLRTVTALSSVSRLDASLLARAFRGELVAQDPADEPASVLLERLRAERAGGEGGAKKGGKRAGSAARAGGA